MHLRSAAQLRPARKRLTLILDALMILLIDNYDSFTHNLSHLIGALGHGMKIKRNDKLTVDDALSSGADAIVLSPGPRRPENAGICVELVAEAARRGMPVFGVCLGMQAIASAVGGDIRRAQQLMHGKTSQVAHDESALFDGVPSPFVSTRYHSLIVDPRTLPADLSVTAKSVDDDEIMAVRHTKAPIAGVQFHPESIASEYGERILQNFLNLAHRSVAA